MSVRPVGRRSLNDSRATRAEVPEELSPDDLAMMARSRRQYDTDGVPPLVRAPQVPRRGPSRPLPKVTQAGIEGLRQWLEVVEVTDIMCRPGVTAVRSGGVWHTVAALAASDEDLNVLIRQMVKDAGYQGDPRNGEYDVSIPDGRLHATLDWAPFPTLVVRSHRSAPHTLDDLVDGGLCTPELGEFLARCVACKVNVLITGAQWDGKTTLCRAMVRLIPEDEMIDTIEDTYELGIHHERALCLAYLARPANLDGVGELGMEALMRGSLRDSTDRVIVGEVRGPEGLYMVRAMTQGHHGSIGTIHGASVTDALERLVDFVLEAPGANREPSHVQRAVARAVDVVVHLERQGDLRYVNEVAEVGDAEGGFIATSPLWLAEDGPPARSTNVHPSPQLSRRLGC